MTFSTLPRLVALALVALLAACRGDSGGPSEPDVGADAGPSDAGDLDTGDDSGGDRLAVAQTSQLVWKRGPRFVNDLSRALQLPPETLCTELGSLSCDEVHIVPLGASEPYVIGLYEPIADPTSLTPIVVDRVVLASCARASREDFVGASPFGRVLGEQALDDRALAGEIVSALYRSLLARDPSGDERDAVLALLDGDEDVSERDFAVAACFAIGTTTEFLFY